MGNGVKGVKYIALCSSRVTSSQIVDGASYRDQVLCYKKRFETSIAAQRWPVSSGPERTWRSVHTIRRPPSPKEAIRDRGGEGTRIPDMGCIGKEGRCSPRTQKKHVGAPIRVRGITPIASEAAPRDVGAQYSRFRSDGLTVGTRTYSKSPTGPDSSSSSGTIQGSEACGSNLNVNVGM